MNRDIQKIAFIITATGLVFFGCIIFDEDSSISQTGYPMGTVKTHPIQKSQVHSMKKVGLKEYIPYKGQSSCSGEVVHVDFKLFSEPKLTVAPIEECDLSTSHCQIKNGWRVDRSKITNNVNYIQSNIIFIGGSGSRRLRKEYYCADGIYFGIFREEETENGRFQIRNARTFTNKSFYEFTSFNDQKLINIIEIYEEFNWINKIAYVKVKQRTSKIDREGKAINISPWKNLTYIVMGIDISIDDRRSKKTTLYIETSRPYLGLLDRSYRGPDSWPEIKRGNMASIVRLIYTQSRPLHIGLHFSDKETPSEISLYESYRFTREEQRKNWPYNPTPPFFKKRLIKTYKITFIEAVEGGFSAKYRLDDTDKPKGEWVIQKW